MNHILNRYLLLALAILAFAGFAIVARWANRSKSATTPSKIRVALLALVTVTPLLYQGLAQTRLFPETYVRFGSPNILPLVALAGLVLGARFSVWPSRGSAIRRRSSMTLIAASIVLSGLVVAEPEIGRPLDRMTSIIAVDRSRSVDLVPSAEERIQAELKLSEQSMREDDRVARVVFAAESATEDPPRVRTALPTAQRVMVGRDGSNLELGIRQALTEIPTDTSGRVVLISDGVQTRGDALSAAAAAMTMNVPVDVVILEQKLAKDIRVVSVRTPSRVAAGQPLDLRVVTSSASDADVVLRVKRDGNLIHEGRVHIAKGEDTLRLREVADEPGLHRYDVEVTADDPKLDESPEDNVSSSFVRVKGPSLALVLEGESGKGAPIVAALSAIGMRVQERTATGVPADIGEMAGFDLIVLSDIAALNLSPSQLDAFSSYVKDLGGGLLLLGGPQSFGPGGYAKTPLEEISPVSFDLKKEKRRASLAEVILIDYSGSMSATVSGQTKLSLANEAAARSASLLGDGDSLGVAHVDTRVAWTIPLGPVRDVNSIGNEIRKVTTGGGGIYTDVALQAGYEELSKQRVNLKHVLLFADGSDAEQITGCRAMVRDALTRGITTSVISLGKGSDTPELEELSKAGNGRFYLVEDATRLPAVFSQETILASKGAISEKPFSVTVRSPTPATRGIEFGQAPPLGGYVITVAKPRATVGLSGPEGDPIYATWAAGLGRTSVFTSDYKDRWGASWLKWGPAAKLFGQAAQDAARRSDDPKVRLESDASGGELRVHADVVGDDGRTQSFRRMTVHVAGPNGYSRELPLEAIGAGRYGTGIPLSRPGTYISTVRDEVTGEVIGTSGTVLSRGEELRPTGSDLLLMKQIAQLTGGKVRATLAGLYDDRPARRFAYTSIQLPMILIAALAMLFGVAVRRLGLPDWATSAAGKVKSLRETQALAKVERARAREAAEARATEMDRINQNLIQASKKRLEDAKARGTLQEGRPFGEGLETPRGETPKKEAARPGAKAGSDLPSVGKGSGLTTAELLAKRRREKK